MAERSLKLETIQQILDDVRNYGNIQFGQYACKAWGQGPRTEEDWRVVDDWWHNGENRYKAAALYAYGPARAPMNMVRESFESRSDAVLRAGLYAAQGKKLEKELVLGVSHFASKEELGDLPERMQISISDIHDWLNSTSPGRIYLATRACANKNVPLKWLFEVMEGTDRYDYGAGEAAVDVLRKKNIPARTLKQYWNRYWKEDDENETYMGMLKICAGRDDVKSIIREGVNCLIECAPEACRGVNFSLSEINEWRRSRYAIERAAAMYASIGRLDVPDAWVAEALEDYDNSVEYAARLAREGRNFPPIRDFEPSGEVYKRCAGNVIVTAKIPKDAEVRGSCYSEKARANKALIVDVGRDFYGERVGVSLYDKQTLYRVGDEVFIPDFDLGRKECSTGFHFYSVPWWRQT